MAKKKRTFDLNSGFRVGALVTMLERVMRDELCKLLVPIDMTYPQFTALMILYHAGPISNSELARLSMMTRQSANEMIKLMESKGWIARQQHPENKRIKLIRITSSGEDALQFADDAAMTVENRMLGNRSDKETKRLTQELETCLAAMGESTNPKDKA